MLLLPTATQHLIWDLFENETHQVSLHKAKKIAKNHYFAFRNFYLHSNTFAAGVTTGVPVLLEENSNGGSLFNRMYYEKEEELGKTSFPIKVFF